MSEKHTPGPWSLKEATSTIPIVGANGRTVASVRYGETDYYDACLIAAAPELLDALVAAEDSQDCNGYIGVETMRQIRAAIAKAEGR